MFEHGSWAPFVIGVCIVALGLLIWRWELREERRWEDTFGERRRGWRR